MYVLDPSIKKDPERRWRLPDRIFFGHGACHILAGTYLRMKPLSNFRAEKITPCHPYAGNHVYVTDGTIAFDYHGYSLRDNLLRHHRNAWSKKFPGWNCIVETVQYDLLNTLELNNRKMLGPDQYWLNPVPRAAQFIDTHNHQSAFTRLRIAS